MNEMKQKCHQCPWREKASKYERDVAEFYVLAHPGQDFLCHTQKYEFDRKPLCRGALDFQNRQEGRSLPIVGGLTSNG